MNKQKSPECLRFEARVHEFACHRYGIAGGAGVGEMGYWFMDYTSASQFIFTVTKAYPGTVTHRMGERSEGVRVVIPTEL